MSVVVIIFIASEHHQSKLLFILFFQHVLWGMRDIGATFGTTSDGKVTEF